MNWRAAALGAIGFSIGGWVLSLGQLLDKKPTPPLQFAQPDTLGGGPLDECTWRRTSPGDCLWDGSRFRKSYQWETKLPDRISFNRRSSPYLEVKETDAGAVCIRAHEVTQLKSAAGELEFCIGEQR